MLKGVTNLQEKLKAAQSAAEVASVTAGHAHEFSADHPIYLGEEEL